jgi:hypothetical protein
MFCNCGGETKNYKMTRQGFTLDGNECKACGRRSLLQSDFDAAYGAHCANSADQTQTEFVLEPTTPSALTRIASWRDTIGP